MGLEAGNLRKLIHPELHIDEFKSKLGDDDEICVISFKVNGKEPAQDLVNFIEKGYSWVVDADVSSGEMDDGDYIVFLEIDRNRELPENVMDMMEDIMRLTEQELSDWRVRYHSNTTDHELTLQDLSEMVPLSPEEYDAKYGTDDDQEDMESDVPDQEPEAMGPELQESLNKLRAVAGVQVTHKAPKNDFTEALRIAAGIR
jgi:hypothetical protein